MISKAGEPRARHRTVAILDSFLEEASHPFSKSKLKKARTNTGVKDGIQEYFLEKLFKAGDSTVSSGKQAAIDNVLRTFPPHITSPVWRMPGMWSF